MARRLHGGSAADVFIDASGAPQPDTSVPAWDSETGGAPLTVYASATGGTGTTVVTSDAYGAFRFWTPDGYDKPAWLAGLSGRVRVDPADLAARVAALEAGGGTGGGGTGGLDLVAAAQKFMPVIRHDGITIPTRASALPGVPRTLPVLWTGPTQAPIDAQDSGQYASDGVDWQLLTQGSA